MAIGYASRGLITNWSPIYISWWSSSKVRIILATLMYCPRSACEYETGLRGESHNTRWYSKWHQSLVCIMAWFRYKRCPNILEYAQPSRSIIHSTIHSKTTSSAYFQFRQSPTLKNALLHLRHPCPRGINHRPSWLQDHRRVSVRGREWNRGSEELQTEPQLLWVLFEEYPWLVYLINPIQGSGMVPNTDWPRLVGYHK